MLPQGLDRPLSGRRPTGWGKTAHDRPEKDGNSRYNRIEADAIVAMLEEWLAHEPFRDWLVSQQRHPAGIGVICMYATQRDLVRKKLRQSALAPYLDRHIKVGTVDSYQGKENPIVILSLVRNNEEGVRGGGGQEGAGRLPHHTQPHQRGESRAMDRLVIVGVKGRWRTSGPMGRMVGAFAKQIERKAARTFDAAELFGGRAGSPPLDETAQGGQRRRRVGGSNG